ncbi:hypothetical protein HZA39_04285 [Candidatus Peregrinibacteria bacterium]|nr:hypothetical protein [Candidatus Peregrinibacteria bacterium]
MLREEDKWDGIVFYCKDCEEIVKVERAGRKYAYRCKKCGTKNVAFGTEKSIANYFHVEKEEEKPKAVPTEKK